MPEEKRIVGKVIRHIADHAGHNAKSEGYARRHRQRKKKTHVELHHPPLRHTDFPRHRIPYACSTDRYTHLQASIEYPTLLPPRLLRLRRRIFGSFLLRLCSASSPLPPRVSSSSPSQSFRWLPCLRFPAAVEPRISGGSRTLHRRRLSISSWWLAARDASAQ